MSSSSSPATGHETAIGPTTCTCCHTMSIPPIFPATGLPMREVDLALRETLHSRRVVLMDACHSGGLSDAFADLRGVEDAAAGSQRVYERAQLTPEEECH